MSIDTTPAAVQAGTEDEEDDDDYDPDRIELRVEKGQQVPVEGDLRVCSGSYGIAYALHIRAIVDRRRGKKGAIILGVHGIKAAVFVNPDAHSMDHCSRYKRRPTTIGPLCWNGYHHPQHAGPVNYEQCRGRGCRCWCHGLAYLSSFTGKSLRLKREREVLAKLAAGRIEELIAPEGRNA